MMIYDFIIVGSGPAGSALASRLADTQKAPRVLLLEAGADNNASENRVAGDRYSQVFNRPDMVWVNQSVPQTELKDRVIPLASGRGLGGISTVNFAMWTLGAAADYNMMAELATKLLAGKTPLGFSRKSRGSRRKALERKGFGGLQIYVEEMAGAFEEAGYIANHDLNAGFLNGLGAVPTTTVDGLRSTAASSYLVDPPANLEIRTEALAAEVLFEGTKAVGVLVNGERVVAKEVILSAGSFRSAQLLMSSGIGPSEHLKHFGINFRRDLPVGQGYQDRIAVPIVWDVNPSCPVPESVSILADAVAKKAARAQLLQKCVNMSLQSRGSVTLQSKSILDYPLIDPKFLSHPFDRCSVTAMMRTAYETLKKSVDFQRYLQGWVAAPKSSSDYDILEFPRENGLATWHPCSTVNMGKSGDSEACVDTEFCIQGMKALRVVDMSVVPIMPNAHLQSWAYFLGEVTAEKIIAEYGI